MQSRMQCLKTEALVTKEASGLIRRCDKLEAVIQHNQSDISDVAAAEYELQKTYAAERSKAFPYWKELQEESVKET